MRSKLVSYHALAEDLPQPSKLVGEPLYTVHQKPQPCFSVTSPPWLWSPILTVTEPSRDLFANDCYREQWILTPHQLDPTRYLDLIPACLLPSFLPEPSSDAMVACNPALWAVRYLFSTSDSSPILSDAHSPMAATAYHPHECQLPHHHNTIARYSSRSSRTPDRSNPSGPRPDPAPSLHTSPQGQSPGPRNNCTPSLPPPPRAKPPPLSYTLGRQVLND